MEYKKYNKKAQIDSTLTWFFAVFIIMFILVLFITMAFLMADKKVLTGGTDVNQNEIGLSSDSGATENLFAIMNSEVQFNGKSEKAINAILDSFDPYFETKSSSGVSLIQKYGTDNYNDITRTTRAQMINDGFNESELDKINNSNHILALELKKKLDLFCNKYKLAIPQGLITEYGELESSDSLGNRIYFEMSKNDPFPADWTPTAVFNISYRGVTTNIEFTELKNCSVSLNQIVGGQNNGQ